MIEKPLSSSVRWGEYRKISVLSLICLASLNITACDYINKKIYPDFKRSKEKVVVEKPPFARTPTDIQTPQTTTASAGVQTSSDKESMMADASSSINKKKEAAKSISIEKVRDIAQNTSEYDPNFTVDPITLNGTEPAAPQAVQPKTEQLFDANVPTTEERFARIENRVQIIADTLNKMSPAITRLIGIESELGALTFQLESLINQGQLDHLAQVPTHDSQNLDNTVSHTAPDGEQEGKQSASQGSMSHLIPKIRLGDHKGKTRIVFETTQKIDYKAFMDEKQNMLIVRFPKGSINADLKRYARASNLVKSISQTPLDDGSVIEFRFNKSSEILKNFHMSPDKEVSNQRIVIDLKR